MPYQSVQQMFSSAAARFGPQLAITGFNTRITYSELESESNRLANFLLDRGLHRGSMVGLFTDNPAQVITGILAMLKAGVVFVPLDPTFPDHRLRVMSVQVQPELYITAGRHLEKLGRLLGGADTPAGVVCLDEGDRDSDATRPGFATGQEGYGSYARTKHPGLVDDPEAACSVYFTSGSTGKPKAILGRLKGIDHFIRWEIEAVGAGPGTRVSQLASPSFDGFLKDVFVPLCSGGVVCAPASRDIIMDARRLADWLDAEQVEVLHCVPSVFRALLNEGLNSRYFEAMRSVVLTGEPLYPADVRRWLGLFGQRIRLWNIYGTTETSLSKFVYEVSPEDVERSSIPVGKPIKGAAALVMNSALRPCHDGVVGEVYIRTPYRSHGYYGEPEMTKEVFVQNPFNDDPSDIVHKTGDFGRFLEDGNLELLGRKDQQVKVRGVRIETGEIENLLRGHEAVADAAVTDREDSGGNKFLVAYVTTRNGADVEQLRHYLAELLPETMVPSAFVKMEKLPRTLNGKLNRKALPAPAQVQARRKAEELRPLNPVQEIVAGIWCEVLGLPTVGRTDNFFNVGGHSLLAMQVILRVRNALKLELPVRAVFESPTVEQFSELIRALTGEGRESAGTPVEPVPRGGELPLSFAQQRMWFMEQLGRGTATLHIPFRVSLKGALNHAALEQTFGEVIRRHESLRTVFPVVTGEPVQVIRPPARITVPLVDLSRMGQAERKKTAERLAETEQGQRFNLEDGPLARVVLIRRSEQEHDLVCTLHHIVSDGWSKGILVKELSALYSAFSLGEPSPLPELPVQYADFAAWERGALRAGAMQRELSYWRENLAGAPPVLNLPTDRPRPSVKTYHGSVEPVVIPRRLSDDVKELSRRKGTTLFMTLTAAFQALLHRYCSQDDVVVGTSVANRERVELEGLVGCFVNMLALRADCSDNPTFEELLERVRETTLRAYEHQALPFEKLVEELQPERDPGYSPLFQAVISFHNQPTLTDLKLPGLTLNFPRVEVTTSQFDLLLDMHEEPEGLAGALHYNSALFDGATMARVAEHFGKLLEGVVSDPGRRLSDLPLLGEEERQALLVLDHARADFPADSCVHELFERQAEAAPDSVAASCGDEHLTYAELNRRANRLARHLRALGVRAGALIGFCMGHSLEEVVGVLGVFKAGAAYLPLDPDSPRRRLAFMLADAGVTVVLTERRHAELVRDCDATPLCLDVDLATAVGEDDVNLDAGAGPQNVAYVIYTSGSTGEPKGVMVSHRSLVNYIWWAKDAYLRGGRLDAALYSSLSFDLTVTSLFAPLLTGNRLIVYPREGAEPSLPEILGDNRAGMIKLTPSHLQMLGGGENGRPAVELLVVGGEALPSALARGVREGFGGLVEIYNEYGPTEATVGCVFHRFDPETDRGDFVPIGRPIPNTRAYILGRRLELLPEGAAGELCIAGECLALGYLNRGGLTAERFVPDPFADKPGARMYRSGDLARRRGGGVIEFLGRNDSQVKVRGFRVELGEVEAAFRSYPGVRDAIVTLCRDLGSDLLVAYYVSRMEVEPERLRQHLSDYIVKEVIPNYFVHLKKLPLTLNGKVDYAALPTLEAIKGRVGEAGDYAAPRTEVEKMVAGIWSVLLGVPRVGRDDNFFLLGGHSLLAMRVVARVRAALGVELTVLSLFKSPTVYQLSKEIETLGREGGGAQLPPLVRADRGKGIVPLSYAQQRLWFIQQLAPDSPAYNIPMALRLTGRLDLSALSATLNEVVRRHEALRTTFTIHEARPYQVIHPHTDVVLAVEDLSASPDAGREAQRMAEQEARTPFDLERGPLTRTRLLRLGDEEHVLLFTMHHIVSDGWSLGVLVREVGALYRAFSGGGESPLAEPPIQYADYAAWQRERFEGGPMVGQLSYWRERLAGAPALLELPTDRAHPAVQSFRGAHRQFVVSGQLVSALKELSRAESVTLFMTLLAGFKVLLSRYTGTADIVVGTPTAGRNTAETEELIGFFVNTLVLRTDVGGDPTFRELLARVREMALRAYMHQETPFEKLVEELQPERSMSYNLIFQVAFALQNAPAEDLELPGLTLRLMEVDNGTSKFDLSLSLDEVGEVIVGKMGYSTDLFEPDTIERMVCHYLAILEAAARDPGRRLSEIEMLSIAERQQVLREWNETSADYPRGQCVHHLFERRAKESAEAPAVDCGDEQLTYGELNRRANQLAHYLRGLGVGPESRVGLFLDRSAEMVVGMLGVLKAGGAYMPLDPEYPRERVAAMLEDSEVRWLLTRQDLADKLPECAAAVVKLDADLRKISLCPKADPAGGAGVENIAYVIYTSGSTGRPKGVMVSHRALVNHMSWMQRRFPLYAHDRVLQKTPFSFDPSVWEFYAPLLAGAHLVMAAPGGHYDPLYLINMIIERDITTLRLVPTLLEKLLEEERLGLCVSLRRVFCGGEALGPRLVEKFGQRLRAGLYNFYGPTEATIVATYWKCEAGRETIPIGRPADNTRVYVLDEGMRPAPVGVSGELYIGGECLARGYWQRPGMTAERFVPDPFSETLGARLYRTGDVARWNRYGELEYLGRNDQQVKVRGYRIELGEIESELNRLEGVRESAVIARDEVGGRRLVAYVAPHDDASGARRPSAKDLGSLLRERLPGYMTPSSFVLLDALPLTPNGKVDRRALTGLRLDGAEVGEDYVAPRTPAERALASIWETVLGVERVGIEDNFFALGGDSIRSVQVVALARERGLSFTLQQLFQYQTVGELTREISVAADAGAGGDRTLRTEPFGLISPEDRERLPSDVEDAYPLLMLQTGMLFHGELNRASALYHNLLSFHVRACFDQRALESAVRRLVERHPVLRTSFALSSYSVPLQLVHKKVELPLQVDDLRGMSEVEQEAALADWQAGERQRHIDWRLAPLLRFHVHQRSDDTFQFSFADHHAILDGWSVSVMLTEIFQSYSSLAAGGSTPAEASPASTFRDLVARERSALESAECREFWQRKLSGASLTSLPRRHSGPETAGTAQPMLVHVPVTTGLSDALKRVARAARTPIKSVLLAAHLRVMSLLGGQEDVVTGVVSHGRPEAIDSERALGLYLNTLPLRLRLKGGAWTELAQEAFAAEREMLPYRHYPMAQLKSDAGGRPLFEVFFNYTHFHVLNAIERAGGLEVLDETAFTDTEFALTVDFSLDMRRSQVRLSLAGKGEVLSHDQMEEIAGYYLTALEAMAADPSARYEAQSLLSERERRRLLVELNDTAVEFPTASCVHRLFEEQAARTPHAVAVSHEGRELTFQELNGRANQLARHLLASGVEPEGRVGVLMERSIDAFVAILGTLKAGAAYVPLDPSYPSERLAFMLEDSRAVTLLTSGPHDAAALPPHAARVISFDTDWPAISRQSEADPRVAVGAENLIYVVYTSGSTGRPKGVLGTHRAMVNRFRWMWAAYPFTAGEVCCHKTSLSFLDSVWEIFGPLLSGVPVVVIPDDILKNMGQLVETLATHRVTRIVLVPSLLRVLLNHEADLQERLPQLKYWVSSGEALGAELANRFLKQMPRAVLLNLYGSSEVAADVLCYDMREREAQRSVPIGRPIVNTEAFILSEGYQLAPFGVAGELHIGGVALARGYLNSPGLTAEKFIPHPFASAAGERVYRTGDVARYLPDGQIEFLGRVDQQVKVRGSRVEIGEVEAALRLHETVCDAAVVTREDASGEKSLAAYFVAAAQAAAPEAAELREYLKRVLPDYMVPQSFTVLDAMPTTTSGKVDRRALPAPAMAGGREYVAPRNELQRQLVGIWEELFAMRPVGVTDNFFELGGESLMMIILVARVEERLGKHFAVADLLATPTIEHLSELIGRGKEDPSRSLIPMQTRGINPPLFGPHPGGGHVLCYADLARYIGDDQPFYGIQAPGLETGVRVHVDLAGMASKYIEAIRHVQTAGPYFLSGWSMGGVIAFEMARQLQAQGEHVAMLALLDSHAPVGKQSQVKSEVLLSFFALDLGLQYENLSMPIEEISALSPMAQLRQVWVETKLAGLVPLNMTLLEFRRLFDNFKINVNTMRNYRPGKYEGHITLFSAEPDEERYILSKDPLTVQAWLEGASPTDPLKGWGELATGGVDLHVVPGNHSTMVREPHVQVLAEQLRACIHDTLRALSKG